MPDFEVPRRDILKTALLLPISGVDRVTNLQKRIGGIPPKQVCFERARLMTESYRRTEGQPTVIRRAKAFSAVLEGIPIQIGEGELIVGNVSSGPRIPYFAAEVFDWRRYQPGAEQVLQDPRFSKDLAIRYRIPEQIAEYWRDRPPAGHVGHFVADYRKVLEKGFTGIRAEIERNRRALSERDVLGRQKELFYEAADIVCRSAELFAMRYAEHARALARREATAQRRKELQRISEVCAKVSTQPAGDFREALQAFWFTHILLHINSPEWSISPGRLDQYLWPYYRKDRAGAEELLACLWIKFNEVRTHSIDLINYQNVIVGGTDGQGKDATNDLSYLFLETTRRIRQPQPSLSLRWHPDTPTALMEKACGLVLSGTGFPAFFNDLAIVPALEAAGACLEDARDYAIAGCEEPSIPAKMFGAVRGSQVCQARCVLAALSHPAHNFDDLMKAYRNELSRATRASITQSHERDRQTAETPHPFASLLFDNCIGNARDIGEGGVRYNITSMSEAGTITAANSLLAIRKAVFEEKTATLEQLKQALRSNFQGHERLRAYLLHSVPKFGNDEDEIDLFARRLAEMNHEVLSELGLRDFRGGCFVTGSGDSTAWRNGHNMGATPDGRLQGQALSVSLGPSAGTDVRGPTAMLNSVAKLNWKQQAGGALTHVKLPYTDAQNPTSVRAISALIQVFFRKAGMGLHFTVVDAAMLRLALQEPEKHLDLMVRVGGFSAPFVLLSPEIQKNIIERTEQKL
jgi:pyruvate formate-lyase/glycerol dehydratase family glycyl radical enzyme